jgi:hypothetical protein
MTTKTAIGLTIAALLSSSASAQLIDQTRAPNIEGDGIRKSYAQQIGAGRGDWSTPDSSSFIIGRDPFRAIRRGRQLFNRKFSREQGLGPIVADGAGDINKKLELGAGMSDSCAGCHGLPRGSAGFGGTVVTRPDGRNAPHLFGLGLREMLADEITAELRARRDQAIASAQASHSNVVWPMTAKGISYGEITARFCGPVESHKDRRRSPARAWAGTCSAVTYTTRTRPVKSNSDRTIRPSGSCKIAGPTKAPVA